MNVAGVVGAALVVAALVGVFAALVGAPAWLLGTLALRWRSPTFAAAAAAVAVWCSAGLAASVLPRGGEFEPRYLALVWPLGYFSLPVIVAGSVAGLVSGRRRDLIAVGAVLAVWYLVDVVRCGGSGLTGGAGPLSCWQPTSAIEFALGLLGLEVLVGTCYLIAVAARQAQNGTEQDERALIVSGARRRPTIVLASRSWSGSLAVRAAIAVALIIAISRIGPWADWPFPVVAAGFLAGLACGRMRDVIVTVGVAAVTFYFVLALRELVRTGEWGLPGMSQSLEEGVLSLAVLAAVPFAIAVAARRATDLLQTEPPSRAAQAR